MEKAGEGPTVWDVSGGSGCWYAFTIVSAIPLHQDCPWKWSL